MTRVEVDVRTGEVREVALSAEEIADAQARTAAEAAARAAAEAAATDPVEKLRAFLAANPDVAGLVS